MSIIFENYRQLTKLLEQRKAKDRAKSNTLNVWTQTEGGKPHSGRLTPSFRTIYSEVTDNLRKEMRNCFVEISHKEAFDLLYKETWCPEEAVMGNSTLPTVLDKLCMVANIHTRKLVELIKAELKIRETRIRENWKE